MRACVRVRLNRVCFLRLRVSAQSLPSLTHFIPHKGFCPTPNRARPPGAPTSRTTHSHLTAGPLASTTTPHNNIKNKTGPAAAARPLRALSQVTDTFVTPGGNPYTNPLQIYAHAREAEAWSHAKAIGIFQKHPSATVVTSGEQLYPAGRSQAVTQNGQQRGGLARSAGGFVTGNPVTLFGVTAISSTDLGARAFAGERSVPMTPEPSSGYASAVGNTLRRWDAVPGRRGTGKERIQYDFATSFTEKAPLSKGVSENGGGPMAHAAAGEAVSMSFADTNDNDRFGSP